MDVFEVRANLIEDYRTYISSFITIRDKRIRQKVEETMKQGHYWPDPLIQLNPAFALGGTVGDLVAQGLLHQRCSEIFRVPETGQQRLDALDFVLRFFLGSRFSILGLLGCIAGVVILVTNPRQNFASGIELLALGLALAGAGSWFIGRHGCVPVLLQMVHLERPGSPVSLHTTR